MNKINAEQFDSFWIILAPRSLYRMPMKLLRSIHCVTLSERKSVSRRNVPRTVIKRTPVGADAVLMVNQGLSRARRVKKIDREGCAFSCPKRRVKTLQASLNVLTREGNHRGIAFTPALQL